MLYGQSLIAKLQAEIEHTRQIMSERQDRIANHETDYDDCFLSINSNQSHINLNQLKIRIIQDGGTMPFEVLYKDGVKTNARIISGKYGDVWLVDGQFVTEYSATSRFAKTFFKKVGFAVKYGCIYSHINDLRIHGEPEEIEKLKLAETLAEECKLAFYAEKGYELRYEDRAVWATYSGGLMSTGCKIFESHTNYATGEED